jgi:hypothetical protein
MSEVKVNKISPRTACGTVTLGDSGDTFTIPSGATINNQGTAVNFGATGSASWVTTVKTSSPFTAVAGEGYFVNTTGGVITVNLPAGTAGAVVAIKDYAGTFDTNKVTLVQNGSDKIGGSTVNATLDVEGIAVTLVYIDSTQGWLVTDSGLQSEAPTAQYITATGGTPSFDGDYKIHTFTGPGAFCVSGVGNAAGGGNTVDYLIVAGGAGGGQNGGGGGGAGGARMSSGTSTGCYSASPLGACVSALAVSATSFPITVGAGGTGSTSGPAKGANGAVSTFSSITSAGGGGGGSTGSEPGCSGGSGGGVRSNGSGSIGTGNTPPVSPPQGNNGGNPSSGNYRGTGGGGATDAGAPGGDGGYPGSGSGGTGITNAITGSSLAYAGGAPGGNNGCGVVANPCGTGGIGGGRTPGPTTAGTGTTNRGGGGGGGSGNSPLAGGNGGSGVVVIRYKFQ